MGKIDFDMPPAEFESDHTLWAGEVELKSVMQKGGEANLHDGGYVELNSTGLGQIDWVQKTTGRNSFYRTALRILYTLTPAILIFDSRRQIVFTNQGAEKLLDQGDVISVDNKGQICCLDQVAQNFLLNYLLGCGACGNAGLDKNNGSFLIPKENGWPIVALVGCDQLDFEPFTENGFKADEHITLMMRNPNGRHPEQSSRLLAQF